MKSYLIACLCAVSIVSFGDPPRFTISTVAGTGKAGFSGDGGPALAAQLNRPSAVALDSKGNLFIADHHNHRVRKVTADGVIRTVVGSGEDAPQVEDILPGLERNLSRAYGIAVDGKDRLLVYSRGHEMLFALDDDGLTRRIAGTGEAGFSGDGGPATEAQTYSVGHMVADGKGNLIVSDSGNSRIRVIRPDGIIQTIAGTGESGYGGDGGPALAAQITQGVAIDCDAAGNVYIADFKNHRIRKIDTNGNMTTLAGTGERIFNGDGLPATESNIGEPTGVACDGEGNVYVADQINNRVRVVTPDGLMYTVAGTGKRGYEGDGGPAEAARINVPDIICVDDAGNVYIPDYLNHVVRKLTRRT